LTATAAPAQTEAGTITSPHGNPYVVATDAHGVPVPFTISVSGFQPRSIVYVEQCNGRPTSAPNWSPTRDCDIGTSPAGAITDAKGNATFLANDRNHALHPFAGAGPETLFNCLSPKAASPNNGSKDYRQCQIRVSSSNVFSTSDQAFLPIAFASTGGGHRSGSSSGTVVIVVVVIALVAALAAWVVFTRRRRASVAVR
jgi:hypothetical protein